MNFNINDVSVSDITYISKSVNTLTYVNTIKRSIVILDVTSEEVKSVIHFF